MYVSIIVCSGCDPSCYFPFFISTLLFARTAQTSPSFTPLLHHSFLYSSPFQSHFNIFYFLTPFTIFFYFSYTTFISALVFTHTGHTSLSFISLFHYFLLHLLSHLLSSLTLWLLYLPFFLLSLFVISLYYFTPDSAPTSSPSSPFFPFYLFIFSFIFMRFDRFTSYHSYFPFPWCSVSKYNSTGHGFEPGPGSHRAAHPTVSPHFWVSW